MASVYKRKMKKGEFWYGSVRLASGKSKAYNTELPVASFSRKKALEHANRVQTVIELGGDPFCDSTEPDKESVSGLIQEFITDRSPFWAATTLDQYVDTMNVVRELFGNRDIRKLCKKDINHYREFLNRRGALKSTRKRLGDLNPNTLNRYLRNLRHFLRWCVEEGGIEDWKPPNVREVPAPPQDTPDYFTTGQFQKLLEASKNVKCNGEPLTRFIALLGMTGMRRGEALSLDWNMIDFKGGKITLPWQATKTRRTRIIPITPVLRVILEQFPNPRTGLLFPKFTENISKHFRKTCIAAGVPIRPLHKLRDTFAVNAAIGGLAPLFLGRILGHSKLQTTYRYYFAPDADALSEQLNASQNAEYTSAVLRVVEDAGK